MTRLIVAGPVWRQPLQSLTDVGIDVQLGAQVTFGKGCRTTPDALPVFNVIALDHVADCQGKDCEDQSYHRIVIAYRIGRVFRP